MIDKCIKCNSENIYYSKKRQLYVCEDCNSEFADEIIPQKVFLSYGHDENKVLIKEIYTALKERGHLPWIDFAKIKAGNEWRSKITHGISDSKFFLSCLSNYSVRVPGVCLDEIAIALMQKSCKIFTILLEKNVSVPNSISNIQWLDMSDWKEYYEAGGVEWQKWFSEKTTLIFDAVEDPSNTKYAGDINELQTKLSPVSMDLKMRLLLQDNLFGRKWLLDEIQAFVNSEKQSIFWLTGAPGSGKSAFAAMMSNYLGICVAVYFCQWDKVETLDAKNIIKSIAFQIACGLPDYRELFINILKDFDCSAYSLENMLEKLLIAPLNSLIDGGREKICVVIDAIDELEEDNFEFAKILNRMLSAFPAWIKFVITSRMDERLKNILVRYNHNIFSLDGARNAQDIRLFVSSKVKNTHLIDLVCEKCNDSFLLAHEYVRILEDNNFDIDSISGVNGAISDLYSDTFNRLFGSSSYELSRIFLEICLSCRDVITPKMMSDIMGISEVEVNNLISRLSSLITVLPYKNKSIIQPRHKTLIDWLSSSMAGAFKLDLQNGEKMLMSFCIKELTNDFEDIDDYVVKHGIYYLNLKDSGGVIDLEKKKKAYGKLAANAHRYGYKQIEREALDRWMILCDADDIEQLMAEIDYATRFSPAKIIGLCDRATALISIEKNEKKRFRYVNLIATAMFYAGMDADALQMIKAERNHHDEIFWLDNSINSEYWHTVSLISHDLDSNEDVVKAATNSAMLYARVGKTYCSLISQVNLFDGYMAIGNLKKADEIVTNIFNELNTRYYVHVDDILHICYANLLLTEGRLMEAFAEYEIGLSLAKDIQNWDYIYGKIWYALALAEFYDVSAIKLLEQLIEEAEDSGYMYLVSLAWSFWGYACFRNNKIPSREAYANAKAQIIQKGKPGHIATIISSGILMGIDEDYDLAVDNYLLCSGGKGCLSLTQELQSAIKNKISTRKFNEFSIWVDKYWRAISEYRTEYRANVISDLPENVLLPGFACVGCESKCCYDGVYLLDDEIPKIQAFVDSNRKFFDFLPEKYIVEGDWSGLNQYKKTEKRPYEYLDKKFPSHFTRTRCVFALSDGRCSLQTRAIELFLHPWKYKPMACWVFPLTGCRNGKILPPPTSQKEDENNIGIEYPGYASFMPCVVGKKNISWKEYYINEIEYFKYIVKNSKK